MASKCRDKILGVFPILQSYFSTTRPVSPTVVSSTHLHEIVGRIKEVYVVRTSNTAGSTKGTKVRIERQKRRFLVASYSVMGSSQCIGNQRNIIERREDNIEPACMKWDRRANLRCSIMM